MTHVSRLFLQRLAHLPHAPLDDVDGMLVVDVVVNARCRFLSPGLDLVPSVTTVAISLGLQGSRAWVGSHLQQLMLDELVRGFRQLLGVDAETAGQLLVLHARQQESHRTSSAQG